MATLYTSRRFLSHDTSGLSEDPERLTHTWRLLHAQGLPSWEVASPEPATREQIERVHRPEVIDRLAAVCRRGGGIIDPAPTVVSPESYDVAFLAAGAATGAAEAALRGEVAFALVRPPGHHATPARSMGFCLFNNIAVAAAELLARGAVERVMIVDFDLHHGNGTQDIFAGERGVLFVSLHQYPIYPGTGRLTAVGAGLDQIVNIPLPQGAGDTAFALALDGIIGPLARGFRPDLILCSCGYDAHWAEQAVVGAGLRVSVDGFGRMVGGLRCLAGEICDGRIAGVLEGGYHLDALAWGVLTTLHALVDSSPPPDPLGQSPEVEVDAAAIIEAVRRRHGLP